jgi:[ribosomal protein S5]-alanine N-acetyltransferase
MRRPAGGAGQADLTLAGPAIPLDHRLETPRLTLRRFLIGDAERVAAITDNWNVARMLRLAPYPHTVEEKRAWLVSHEAEWLAGEAYRFALTRDGVVIGCADIDELTSGFNEIGYWLDEHCWGQGLATEAATAVRDFALNALGLGRLTSGHAFDNPDSGHVLEKLGFRWFEDTTVWSLPRQAEIVQRRYLWERRE